MKATQLLYRPGQSIWLEQHYAKPSEERNAQTLYRRVLGERPRFQYDDFRAIGGIVLAHDGNSVGLRALSGVPLFEGIRPVRRSQLPKEPLPGVTLAAMNIPQVLGYARIAGAPVVTRLYTLLLPIVTFATFGSSRYPVVAADSATAAIVAA